MVKIAIAGGSGHVGREILDALAAAQKHDIRVLSRKDAPETEIAPGVTWLKVSYEDTAQLVAALEGVETVLSFITEMDNEKSPIQRNLIDAAIRANVRRFAPSEWSTSHLEHLGWYSYKNDIRNYLAELNKEKKVLEYSLFHPGLFTNYFTFPFNSSKHFSLFELPINFHQRRALVREGGKDDVITLTTVQDLAKVLAHAVEYEGEWPVSGGMKGTEMTIAELIALGEKIRGPFEVEELKNEDLEARAVKPSWIPKFSHPNVPLEEQDTFAVPLLSGFLLSISAGAWKVTDDAWNERLPDYKFTQAEEFLTGAWAEIDAGAKSLQTKG
ncbi:hypothetical protein B0T10DRAFT_593266 [Thelonectria olida]|uniref:NmrA-like domain-containing protein n=1 Tax=Thelonectria olida TaxID=1576542 RepID=A0A9P8VSK0_9HYPO|nr:hypothetical protein B0T10DRAFT_593266 [Thelonectria olida]